jgi:hypothetical protein
MSLRTFQAIEARETNVTLATLALVSYGFHVDISKLFGLARKFPRVGNPVR